MSLTRPERDVMRIGELAERAGVSVATIKYYIREGLLSPPPVKTGRTMGYYDQAYLDRLRLIRTLREEHFLPIRVIRAILAERGDRPLDPGEAAVLARIGPSVLGRLDPDEDERVAPTREQLLTRFGLDPDELDLLEEMGLIGEVVGQGHKKTRKYHRSDVELLEAMQRAEAAGLTRDRFPVEGLGHYVELVGELARREVRTFGRQAETMPAAEVESIALRAIEVSEPLVAVIRRKLILRALREELARQENDKKQEVP